MPTADQIAASLRTAGLQTPAPTPRLQRRPEPILGFDVSADEAIGMWERLRAETDRTGLYPVVFADEHETLAALGPEELATPDEAISLAAKLDPAKWLRDQLRGAMEDGGPEEGEWPEDVEPHAQFGITHDHHGEPRSDLAILLLPTRTPWHACSHLGFNAFNQDIEPHHHAAVHRHWQERHGAELVSCGGDTLEFRVARPPRTREEAMTLAREQYGYCTDIVDQGVESIEALAAVLLDAPVWFFWWD